MLKQGDLISLYLFVLFMMIHKNVQSHVISHLFIVSGVICHFSCLANTKGYSNNQLTVLNLYVTCVNYTCLQ